MTETPDDSIRERPYHLWEASGQPAGRDEEFWHRAREMVATNDDQPTSQDGTAQPKQAQPARPPRKRSRLKIPPAASVQSAPAG
jgi:hypothetical protein